MELQDKTSGLHGMNLKDFDRRSQVRERYEGQIPDGHLKSKRAVGGNPNAGNKLKSNMTKEKSAQNAMYQETIFPDSAQDHMAQTKLPIPSQQGNGWDYHCQAPLYSPPFKGQDPEGNFGWQVMSLIPWSESGINMETLRKMCGDTSGNGNGTKANVVKNRAVVKNNAKANREFQKERQSLAKAKVESWFKQTDKIISRECPGNDQENVGDGAEQRQHSSTDQIEDKNERHPPNYNNAKLFCYAQTEGAGQIQYSEATKAHGEWQESKEDANDNASGLDKTQVDKEDLTHASEYEHMYAHKKPVEVDAGRHINAYTDGTQYYEQIPMEQFENTGSMNYQGFDDTISLALTMADLKSSVIDAIPNIMDDSGWRQEGHDALRVAGQAGSSQVNLTEVG